MSGINNVGNDPRALFDRLIGEKSSAFVLRDGEVVSDSELSFNSGLHRLGFKKSEEDIQSNQRTMKYLLDHVSKHVTEDEMQQIMESKIKLGTEKEGYTVRERLERGTYVSSDLVKQLRMLSLEARIESTEGGTFREEDIGANPIHSMTEGEGRRLARQNGGVVDYAFGVARIPGARRDHAIANQLFRTGTVSEMALTKFGDRTTPFQDSVKELCRDGTETNPAGETDVWKSFSDFWTRTDLPEEQETERTTLINEFRRRVDSQVAELSARGIRVTPAQVKAMLKDQLVSPQQMMKFEQETKLGIEEREGEIALETARQIAEANNKLVEDMGPDRLARGIQQWLVGNPQFEESGRKLLQDLAKAGGWTRELNLTPEELRSIGEIEARLRGGQPGGSPLELTDKLREALKVEHTANPSREPLTDQQVGRLLDGTLREILTPAPQQPVDEELQSKLNGDMEAFFPSLNDVVSETRGNTIGRKTGDLLGPRIEELSLKQAVQKARLEGKDLALPEVQREVAENTMQMIARHREMQERVLPVLDEYVAFQREIEDLGEGDDGLPGLDRDTLLQLDARSDQLKARRQELEDYKNLLNTDFGSEIEDLSGELDRALMEMAVGHDYDMKSGRPDREYAMQVEKRLGRMGLHSDVPAPLDGVSPGLNRQIQMFNGLRAFVFDLAQKQDDFDKIESLSQLFRRTLYEPMQQRIEKDILDRALIKAFARGDVREAQQRFDEQWRNEIETRIPRLEEFGPVPPPPAPPTTVQSIDKYRRDLTDYIERAKGVKDQLQDLGSAFGELSRTEAEAMFEAMRSVDSYIGFAGRALQALERD